jgi:hypothetical protein
MAGKQGRKLAHIYDCGRAKLGFSGQHWLGAGDRRYFGACSQWG